MAKYVFVESRDPYESVDCAQFLDMIEGVRARHHEVTLFLVQNAVLAVRDGSTPASRYRDLARAGVTVVADAFALRERQESHNVSASIHERERRARVAEHVVVHNRGDGRVIGCGDGRIGHDVADAHALQRVLGHDLFFFRARRA